MASRPWLLSSEQAEKGHFVHLDRHLYLRLDCSILTAAALIIILHVLVEVRCQGASSPRNCDKAGAGCRMLSATRTPCEGSSPAVSECFGFLSTALEDLLFKHDVRSQSMQHLCGLVFAL